MPNNPNEAHSVGSSIGPDQDLLNKYSPTTTDLPNQVAIDGRGEVTAEMTIALMERRVEQLKDELLPRIHDAHEAARQFALESNVTNAGLSLIDKIMKGFDRKVKHGYAFTSASKFLEVMIPISKRWKEEINKINKDLSGHGITVTDTSSGWVIPEARHYADQAFHNFDQLFRCTIRRDNVDIAHSGVEIEFTLDTFAYKEPALYTHNVADNRAPSTSSSAEIAN